MAVIEVRHLSLSRGGREVLHDISFDADANETLVLIGPSGGGKSSLLRCLNRLEEPAPGTVFLNGEDITTLPVTELRCRIGMVFQIPAMFPGTVADNVGYGPALRGKPLSAEQIATLLEMVTLDPALASRPADQLSGGQAQRVAIARALANKSQVLLLDEPTSALDPIATRAVEETLLSLRDRLGLCLIWVSHQVEQARRVGDRALLLDSGRVLKIDRVDRMLDPENGDQLALAFERGLTRAEAQADRAAAPAQES